MMFLSDTVLNPERRGARELVASPQRMHAAVLGSFLPGASQRGRILWRLDHEDRHRLHLFVVSPERPSFDALIEQAGWTANPVWRSADYRGFLKRLAAGQRWVFHVRANPTTNVGRPGQRGKRIPLVTREQQRGWLVDRAPAWGFGVVEGGQGTPNLQLRDRSRLRFERRTDGRSTTVSLETVRFSGVLEVQDAELLREALTVGIGSGKGYGCGLMTLARPT